MGRIDVTEEAGAHVLTLAGEHDLSTAPDLQRAIDRLFDAGSCVILDLRQAEFIDSTVLNAVIAAHKRAESHPDRTFAVVASPDTSPDHLLRLVHLDTVVPTFSTLTDASALCL
jgi:stage II sporulation protein AA (anti-sigma F factor antagonist)